MLIQKAEHLIADCRLNKTKFLVIGAALFSVRSLDVFASQRGLLDALSQWANRTAYVCCAGSHNMLVSFERDKDTADGAGRRSARPVGAERSFPALPVLFRP